MAKDQQHISSCTEKDDVEILTVVMDTTTDKVNLALNQVNYRNLNNHNFIYMLQH